jgi:hypothetical protein
MMSEFGDRLRKLLHNQRAEETGRANQVSPRQLMLARAASYLEAYATIFNLGDSIKEVNRQALRGHGKLYKGSGIAYESGSREYGRERWESWEYYIPYIGYMLGWQKRIPGETQYMGLSLVLCGKVDKDCDSAIHAVCTWGQYNEASEKGLEREAIRLGKNISPYTESKWSAETLLRDVNSLNQLRSDLQESLLNNAREIASQG